MKKNNARVFLLFVCVAIYIGFLMMLTLNINTNYSSNNSTSTNINNYNKEKINSNTNKTNEVKYKYVKNINELIEFTNQYTSSGEVVPLIVIGLNGNYCVDGIDTGITSNASTNSFGENGAYVLFVEKTSEKDEELIYSIMYSNKRVKEFKVNKETNKVTNEFNLDITVGENGNWYINGNDTGINATSSGYENYLNEYNRKLSKEEWLRILSEGELEIKETVNVRFYPDNGDYPYTLKYVKGTKLVKFVDPEIDGYSFMGWLNEENKFLEYGKSVIDSDIELHAVYKKNDYLLTLNSDNGENNEYLMVHYNEEVSLYTPTKNGFAFLGWFYNDKVQTSLYSINKDAMFVAKWRPIYTLNRANSDSVLCNSALTIKDLSLFDDWYCDDMLVLYPGNQVAIRTMTSMDDLDRASSNSSVINDETKLDIVGETKSRKTAMIQELDYESEPRYYVRT